MSISYKKLFTLMDKRGVKKTHLRYIHNINHKTISRLVNNRSVTVDTIVQLCTILDCQPGDIMECIKEPAQNKTA